MKDEDGSYSLRVDDEDDADDEDDEDDEEDEDGGGCAGDGDDDNDDDDDDDTEVSGDDDDGGVRKIPRAGCPPSPHNKFKQKILEPRVALRLVSLIISKIFPGMGPKNKEILFNIPT